MELKHPDIEYYDAVQRPLARLGHNVSVVRGRPALERALQRKEVDVVLVGFGWFSAESGAVPGLPEFARAARPYTCACSPSGSFLASNRSAVLLLNLYFKTDYFHVARFLNFS